MVLKEAGGKQILIAAIITILLQSGIVAGMAIHGARIDRTEKQVEMINKNYIPTFFLEGLILNMNYQTQEIVATMNGDAKKIHEINEKYIIFQESMIKTLNDMRGSITPETRGVPVIDTSNY